MAKVLKRDVDAAAAKLQSRRTVYGPNDMASFRAEDDFYALRPRWEAQTGRGYHRALPVI